MIMPIQDKNRRASVPAVDFYGDSSTWPTSELLHSEKLVERSALHDWRIRPHRHNDTAQLFLVLKGHGKARLDSVWYEIAAPCLVVIPERAVHEFKWNESSDGYVLSIRTSLIASLAQRMDQLSSAFAETAIIDTSASGDFLRELFAAIDRETEKQRLFMDAALDALVRVLAIWLTRNAEPPISPAQLPGRAGKHLAKFSKLVDEHHKSHWSVADYASAIGITPAHLNTICQELSGKSTLEIIHARLVLAAQRELAYTERNIAGVADHLGFVDPSYFTRFFKRETGMTPGEYRRRSGTFEG